jgi:hypothetical protein
MACERVFLGKFLVNSLPKGLLPLEFAIRVSERPKSIRPLARVASSSGVSSHTHTVYFIFILELNFGTKNIISFSVSCTSSVYILLVTLVSLFVGKMWKRHQCHKLSPLPLPFILRSPPPPHWNLIPITAKVAPSFPARVGGVMMTRYLRDKRVLTQKSCWWRWQRHLSLKIYPLILKIPFWFPLNYLH